jgi:hypothetical protein
MISQIDSWHRKISTGPQFQNGRHNTAQIQHCSISTSWIDSRHCKISTGLHFQNGHHNPAKNQADIIIYQHMKFRWNRTMLNLCGIVVAILKMGTGRNFPMSGINSGHHAISYVGRLWCPELIPEIEKFLPVSIFKMAATIPQKFQR